MGSNQEGRGRGQLADHLASKKAVPRYRPRKAECSERLWPRDEPYNRPNCELSGRLETRPNRTIPKYVLSISASEAVIALKDLSNVVKWPQKMVSPSDRRNKSKWCEFHAGHGHWTNECIALRYEVLELLLTEKRKKISQTQIPKKTNGQSKQGSLKSIGPFVASLAVPMYAESQFLKSIGTAGLSNTTDLLLP